MSLEKESRLKINHSEGRERSLESKDKQTEELEKKMGARERVEKMSHEVKSTQKQMQNIVTNMQQVMGAVAAIRKQLQLDEADTNIPSVHQDQKTVQLLQKKLANLNDRLQDLRLVLLQEEKEQIREAKSFLSEEELQTAALKRVEDILGNLGIA
jgi:DNA repair exonuclease SbcCD ATPase subunit